MEDYSGISKPAFELIVAEEVSSQQAYERLYYRTEWPGASSGVTIGIGYDCGYSTPARMREDWGGKIPDHMIEALITACGVTGARAKPLAAKLKPVVNIPWEAALDVFENVDVPRWAATVRKSLPNTELLSSGSFGALVSLAYNRGPSFSEAGDRFREMRAIKAHMVAKNFDRIPNEFRSMKRLWPDLSGLRDRRDREAILFERGLHAAPAQNAAFPTTGRPVLKLGSVGDYVKRVQRILKIIIDGIFLHNTEAAVKSFQAAHNLKSDGVVGPLTWAVLEYDENKSTDIKAVLRSTV